MGSCRQNAARESRTNGVGDSHRSRGRTYLGAVGGGAFSFDRTGLGHPETRPG